MNESHHSITAVVTVSAAVHHSTHLIATDNTNGGMTVPAAIIKDPIAVSVNAPAAAIGKGTAEVGASRLPLSINAEVGVPHREYTNANTRPVDVLYFHGEAPLLSKRNTVKHNPNAGKGTKSVNCGDHSAARRDFQGAVAAVGGIVKESLQCGTKKKKAYSTRIACK